MYYISSFSNAEFNEIYEALNIDAEKVKDGFSLQDIADTTQDVLPSAEKEAMKVLLREKEKDMIQEKDGQDRI